MDTRQSVFKQFILSVYRFDAYPAFLRERGRKVFLYSLLLIALTYLVTFVYPSVHPVYGTVPRILSLSESDITELIPYFEISNGRFYIEEPLIMDNALDGALLYLTSDEVFPRETALGVLNDYIMGIIADSEKLITGGVFQKPQVLYFADFPDGYISRDELIDFFPWFKAIIIIIYVPVFAAYIGMYMFGALVCALIGMVVNLFIKAPVNFKGMFKLTAYARTLPIMLKMIMFVLPFNIAMPFTVFYILFILYMVWALLAVKKTNDISDVFDL